MRCPRKRSDSARALGRRRRDVQRRIALRREVVPREDGGGEPRSAPLAPLDAAGARRIDRRRVRRQGPRAVGEHRVRGERERDRVRVGAHPRRPGRRSADGRRGGAVRDPLLRVQLPRVALAGPGRSVLARPSRTVARRGQRDDGPAARGPRARAWCADPRGDPRLQPLGRRLPPDGAASRRGGRRSRDQGRVARRRCGPERRRVCQQPRHGNCEERSRGDRSDEGRPRTAWSAARSR